ncbi:MAG: aspartate dehydrogenase [Lachnospiraceae bacterium]
MFGRRKIKTEDYDKENKKPVIRASICTGEQAAGFKDVHTGKFEEVMLIKNHKDMEVFRQRYGISEEEIVKEY